MMAFQFDQLLTLTAVIEEGTFDAAARRLRVTASAVSQRIKAMERTAGQVLVQRTNPVLPTAAGDIVLRLARQTQLLEHDTTTALHRGARDGNRVSVPLAVNADSLATWFLEALAEVPDEAGAAFDIHREDQELTTSLLRSGSVMAAVTSTADAVQGCTSVKLGIMRYRGVCSPRFAERWVGARPGPAGLGDAPVVVFDRTDDLQHRFIRSVTGRDLQPPRHYVPTSADFARAVVLGLGWAVLPEQQCLAEIKDGRLLELFPGHHVDVGLYWQRWNLASPLLDAITGAVRGTAAVRLHPM